MKKYPAKLHRFFQDGVRWRIQRIQILFRPLSSGVIQTALLFYSVTKGTMITGIGVRSDTVSATFPTRNRRVARLQSEP